ncbi:MAG: hypothetical protein ACRC7G_13965 [Beijerinckiaceae bacterium]
MQPDPDQSNDPDEPPKVDPTAALRQIDAIRMSPDLGMTDRLSELLRFLVIEELEGRGDRLKAYVIATSALGRNADFDPALDSIVRVEMARLRTVLKLYYSRHPDAPVVIDIPKGGSRPTISANTAPVASPRVAEVAQPKAKSRFRRREDLRLENLRLTGPIILAGLAVLFAAAAAFALFSGSSGTRRAVVPAPAFAPLVLVSPVTIATDDIGLKALERGLKAELVAELSSYPWLAVAFRSENRLSLEPGQAGRSIYALNLNIAVEGPRFSLVAALQDAATGQVRWSHSEASVLPEGQRFPTLASMTRRIAAEIGRPLGALTQAEIDAPVEQAGGDYGCLLKLRAYGFDWTRSSYEAFRACALGSDDGQSATTPLALGLAARAHITEARLHGAANREVLLSRAEGFVRTALATRSSLFLLLSAESQLAACRGDRERYAAIRADIVRRRGNDPDALSQLAYLDLFAFGDVAAAESLSERAERLSLVPQPLDALTPAMMALRAGDAAAARARLERLPGTEFPVALLLLSVAQAETNNPDGVARAFRRLANIGYPSAIELNALIDGECWNAASRERIRRGLDAALRSR